MAYEKFIAGLGDVVDATLANSKLPRMQGILLALRAQPSITPVRMYIKDEAVRVESLEVLVEADIPQDRVRDIRPVERILIQCMQPEFFYPAVWAMRPEFPVTPHQSGSHVGEPRCLCLYAEPFAEQELIWNPTEFLIRIASWLRDTAMDKLHPDDQPLEPFFFTTTKYVIAPPGMAYKGQNPTQSWLTGFRVPPTPEAPDTDYTILLRSVQAADVQLLRQSGVPGLISVLAIETNPTEHGIVHAVPRTFDELCQALTPLGVDLLERVRDHITACKGSAGWNQADGLMLLVRIPLLRHGQHQGYSTSSFLMLASILDVGLAVDVLTRDVNTGAVNTFVALPGLQRGNNAGPTPMQYLSVLDDVNAPTAAAFSGATRGLSGEVVTLAGGGALGSDVFSNLIRSGFPKWRLVDDDTALPHNLVHHRFTREHVGSNKAYGLSIQFGNLWPGVEVQYLAKSVQAALFHTASRELIEQSTVILDCTASPAASRTLCLDFGGEARRVTCFATPSVNDSVILAEDKARTLRLDSIEAQYYRFVLRDPVGDHHLVLPKGKYRYGLGCRDRSTVMPPEAMGLHASLLTTDIKTALAKDEACATIFARTADGVRRVPVPLAAERRAEYGGLTIVWDEEIERTMADIRAKGLPNETGGPLIGYFDAMRKIVYIVDALPPPADSKAGRGHFVRGSKDLCAQLTRLQEQSGNVVAMVGDWHSHPLGVAPKPSGDDLRLLMAEGVLMAQDGRPGLIAIVGDDGRPNFYVGMLVTTEVA